MGNIGGPEILVVLLLALIVLGPDKLPGAAKQIGQFLGEIKKISSGFQQEMQDALKAEDKPIQKPLATEEAPAETTAPDAEAEPADDAPDEPSPTVAHDAVVAVEHPEAANGVESEAPPLPADMPYGGDR